jgi:flagellar M-ring protein FliF
MIWQSSTPAARVSIVTLLVLCFGLVIGVGYWSAQPSYVTLVSDLDSATTTEIVTALERGGIQYQMINAGTVIQVDKRNYSRAKQIANSNGAQVDNLALEPAPGFGSGPSWENEIKRRNQERQISTTILRFPMIEKAVVHLSLPEVHPFIRDRVEAKASVVLTIKRSAEFGEQHAQAISSLVANAVVGLKPSNISITDTNGRTYSAANESVAVLTRQEDFRMERERILASRAQQQLAHLGYENFTVSVTADFDFKEANTTKTQYDPDGKVVVMEKNKKDKVTSADDIAAGAAGVGPNLNATGINAVPGSQVKQVSTDTTTEYANSQTTTTHIERAPTLTKLTVSVVVNEKAAGVVDAQGVLNPEMKDNVTDTIKNAVGFIEDRDSISVVFTPFPEMPVTEVVATPIPWEQINEIVRNVSLGIAAVIALALGFFVLRTMKPAPLTESIAATSVESAPGLGQLGELLKNNPEAFAQIVAAWANIGEGNGDSKAADDTGEKRQAA